MKFTFEQSSSRKEIVIYAPFKDDLIEQIENMCLQDEYHLVGYLNSKIKEINPLEVECFISRDDQIFAIINKTEYRVKKRLYELAELLQINFIYINQSCLANINLIDHFDASFGGTLMVIFKSGFKDYVSRRQIKKVKERILKK